jgi:hypothetical protein
MRSLFMLSVKFPQLWVYKYSCVISQRSQLTIVGPSTSRALTELEQVQVLNEVLDDETLAHS